MNISICQTRSMTLKLCSDLSHFTVLFGVETAQRLLHNDHRVVYDETASSSRTRSTGSATTSRRLYGRLLVACLLLDHTADRRCQLPASDRARGSMTPVFNASHVIATRRAAMLTTEDMYRRVCTGHSQARELVTTDWRICNTHKHKFCHC